MVIHNQFWIIEVTRQRCRMVHCGTVHCTYFIQRQRWSRRGRSKMIVRNEYHRYFFVNILERLQEHFLNNLKKMVSFLKFSNFKRYRDKLLVFQWWAFVCEPIFFFFWSQTLSRQLHESWQYYLCFNVHILFSFFFVFLYFRHKNIRFSNMRCLVPSSERIR